MIIPLDSFTVIGLTLERAALKKRKSEEAVLDVTGMSADAQRQLHSKDCGIKLSQGCLETIESVLTAHRSWKHGQCEVIHLAQTIPRWNFPASCRCTAGRVGLKNWQIREINGLQIN